MSSKNFDAWLGNFKSSIATYNYYIDFEKVYSNVADIKVELSILNSLIGERDIEAKFVSLLKRYPETLKCIPILLAVRNKEIEAISSDGKLHTFNFNWLNQSIEMYCEFTRETGLFELLEHHIINNIVDYVCGVETGLDSNGRKNRGGHLMEDVVESYLLKCGLEKNRTYFKEMYTSEIQRKWGINLNELTNEGGTEKRFDYVVKAQNNIYLIETNFYASGGSKLNETARSYKTLALEANRIPSIEFVWITDGKGWTSARKNLKETFDVMEHIYSIDDLERGIFDRLFR